MRTSVSARVTFPSMPSDERLAHVMARMAETFDSLQVTSQWFVAEWNQSFTVFVAHGGGSLHLEAS